MKDFFSRLKLWLRSYRLTSAWMKKSTEWIPLWVKQLPHLFTGEIEIAQLFFFFTHYANFFWTWSQAAALSSNRGDFPLGSSLCPLLKHQLEAKLSSLTHSVGCLKGCSAIQGTYCKTWNSSSALCSLKDVSSNPDTIQSSRPETSRNN